MKKFLIIEDDPVVCNNIIKILKSEGFDAIGAENGLIGVELAQKHHPDLIICDIMMPELDGYGVLKKLQDNTETTLIPFIFLTAKTDRIDIRKGIELGADDYLVKPFEVQELLGAIKARFQKQDLVEKRLENLSDELSKLRKIMEAKDDLLDNFNEELRRPLSNIKLAIDMLNNMNFSEQHDQYLKILQEEFSREIALLNQVADLKNLLTPENINLLYQFKMLKKKD